MRLAEARKRAGCTPEQLDVMAGVRPGTVAAIEAGKVKVVSRGTAGTIAASLCLKVDEIDEFRSSPWLRTQ